MLKRWDTTNGYRDVLKISLPLIISMASTTVMQFTDRIFLANYSLEAIAAATPAGMAQFLFVAFFMGVGGYVNVFIAQYIGSRQPERVGSSLWQGIYFGFFSAVCMASLYWAAPAIFKFGGHPEPIQILEISYFRILCLGSGISLMSTTLACFYSGRGITTPVMLINMVGACVNIPLDYCLINGVGFFPELGIQGAALATVTSWVVVLLIFVKLIFSSENEKRFGIRKEWRFDRELFGRYMKYGLPGGVQFFVDMFAITFFLFMAGRLGTEDLAINNIALNLDTLAFLPMIGFHIALETLVGQSIGAKRPDEGAYATGTAIRLTCSYMGFWAILYLFIPETLLLLFKPRSMALNEFMPLMEQGIILLRFIAAYCFFDGLSIVFFGAIKGAGDTMFTMKAIGFCALFCMIIPAYVIVECFGMGLIALWWLLTAYVVVMAAVSGWRFYSGKWKAMSVLE